MKISSIQFVRLFCLFAASVVVSSCAQQAYKGPSKGMDDVATLIIDQGQADRIELNVNGEIIEGPSYKVTSLPGQTVVKLKYHLKSDSEGAILKRTGECSLTFDTVKRRLYELRLGFLNPGTQHEASQATFTVREFNTWPTSVYGAYDKKAMQTCKDLGVE